MSTPLRILFIDDDPAVLTVAKKDLADRLNSKQIPTQVVDVSSVEEGVARLRSESFHLTVVDLKFGTKAREGNKILADILETRILPIIVYSGYKHELDEKYENHGLIFVAPVKRIEHLVHKISEWQQRKVFDFFSETGFLSSEIRKTLQRTMWDHVSRYWEHLETDDQDLLARTAGRIAATLFHDGLVSSPQFAAVTGEVPIHHGEIYILQTPRDYLAVGDILKMGGGLFVVLTPACDLVFRGTGDAKAKIVLFGACQSLIDFAGEATAFKDALKDLKGGKDTKKRKKAEKRIEQMMRHAWLNDDGRRFFLPPFADFSGGVIDFLKIRTEPYDASNRAALVKKRMLSLNREVAAELATRFARYMIRLGQAPYQADSLIKTIEGITSGVT